MRPLSAVLLISAVLRAAFGQTYTIDTFAGGGSSLGDNGPAAAAQLLAPSGVVVDRAGDLYIADYSNSRVRKVSSGVITTVAGNGTFGFSGDNGPATSAQLSAPAGVAVDSAGNFYIADYGNSCIRKVSDGVITTVAGNGTPGYSGDNGPATSAQLNGPYGLAVDSAGNLYIADVFNYRIRKVSNGVITTVAGNGTFGFSGDNGPATSAQLLVARRVALDSVGSLYIADSLNGRIRKVSNGVITTVAGNGTFGFSGDNGPATSAQLDYPEDVAVDSANNLYIADAGNNRVRRVSIGTIMTVAGDGAQGFSGDNGPATSAQLDNPMGVSVDSAGDVFIADQDNDRIRMAMPTVPNITAVLNAASYSSGGVSPGEIVSIFGTSIGPANPAYLTLDSTGKVSTSIGGVTVSFGGHLAPLTYVSSTQINAIVPYEVAGSSSSFAEVMFGGQISNEPSLQLAVTAPGIFTQNSSGTGPGAILDGDSQLNTQQNPAAKGSTIQIFMTGEGLTNPAQATGAVTPENTSGVGPLTPAPQLTVSVLIGNHPAQVIWDGEAPYLVAGVLQVDAVVPTTASSGANSITAQVGNQISQSGVTLWVQ